eukprot:gene10130-2549_t
MEKQNILDLTNYPKIYAASQLGLSVVELTEKCKELGINRWPYHSRNKNQEVDKVPFKNFKIHNPPSVTKKRKQTQDSEVVKNLKKLQNSTIIDSRKNFESFFPSTKAKKMEAVNLEKKRLEPEKRLPEKRITVNEHSATNGQNGFMLPSFDELVSNLNRLS